MITFEKIRFKNFLSYGNQFQEINFSSSKTTLVIGLNGNGKSTFLDALTFALFGKSFRGINKSQLVNSINEKDCLVELDFAIGKTQYLIRRGIKPNIFEIIKDGKLLDQKSSAIDQQKWFEQSVLKMNFKSFTQIVIIGSSNFVPFMQLSSANRREVIEDLLDIKIFSSMNNLIKDKIRALKEEVRTLDLKKQSLKDKVEMQKNFIEEIENQGKESIKKKQDYITQLLRECETYSIKNDEIEEEIFSLTKDLKEVSGAKEKLKKLGNLKGKISQKIELITKEHKFFNENEVCPTCTQHIDEDFRKSKINETKEKAKELSDGYEELTIAIKDEEIRESHFIRITEEINSLNNQISKNNISISSRNRQIRDLESEIVSITENLNNKNIEKEKLENYRNNLESVFEEICSKNEDINHFEFSHSLLKDGGIKTKIIKKYIPLINQEINKYLQMMDFYINFILDEEFNETIQSPIHEDFTYSSFSEGEKSRINLSLLFAWREVAKLKNSVSCNLIIFDEVFDSSLDSYGTDEFLKIIRYVVKDANIFVISHKNGMEDKFENVLQIRKEKNFSFIAK